MRRAEPICSFMHLDFGGHLSQSFWCCSCSSFVGLSLPASQVSASDHVVGTTCGRCGRNVRRFTSGEENDATEQEVLTLLYRKVTAQLEVNSSC
jgi:hypothetical protein